MSTSFSSLVSPNGPPWKFVIGVIFCVLHTLPRDSAAADINITKLTIEQNGVPTSAIWKDKPATFTAQTDCTDPGPIYSCKWAGDLSDQTCSWSDGKDVVTKAFPEATTKFGVDDKKATFEVYKNADLIAAKTEPFAVAEIKIKQGANNITDTTHSEIVGKKINLTAEFKPTGLPLTDQLWTIPQKRIGGYTENNNLGKVLPVDNLNSSSVVFYWVDDADGRKVQWSGKADNNPGTAKATFDVKRPNATIQATTSGVSLDNNYSNPVPALHMGDPRVNHTPGALLGRINYSIPAGFSGSTEWIQIVSVSSFLTLANEFSASKVGTALDEISSTTPYEDSPGVHLLPYIDAVDITDNFTTWLMFKPSGTGSINVPLRVVSWGWKAYATRSGSGTWTLHYGISSANPPDNDSTTHPQWNQYIDSIPVSFLPP